MRWAGHVALIGERRSACRVLVGKAVGESSLEVPGIDRRIILRHMFRHSGSPRPKKFRVQKSAGKVLTSIFWDQDGILPLIIFQTSKLSKRSITHLCWCNWRAFEGKTPREGLQGGSCSCTTMPRLTGHLQPRRNWPTWASRVLITHRILRIWPRRTANYSLDWKKKQLKDRHFSSDAEVIAATDSWLEDNFLNCFSDLQKLQQWDKKCIELRGKYVE